MWPCHNRLFMWLSDCLRREPLQPGTVQSLSVGLVLISWLYEKQPDFQAFFDPGACHLPNEWFSLLDSWASHSLSCHETSEPTVLAFTAEDCFQRPHLHTFRAWHDWNIIMIIIIMHETVYGHNGWLLLKIRLSLCLSVQSQPMAHAWWGSAILRVYYPQDAHFIFNWSNVFSSWIYEFIPPHRSRKS